MTPEQEAAIRERHQLGSQWTDGINPTAKFCRCGESWPCDTAIVLAALDEANALLVPIDWWVCVWCDARFPYTDGPDTLKAHSTDCPGHPAVKERDAARADADRLAATGHHATVCAALTVHGLPSRADCDCGWGEALTAHEEEAP